MRGDTLIEVLIALAVAVVVISGITVLGTTSLNNAQFVAAQDQASKYAQEGLEITRQIRNSSYAQFASFSGIYCLNQDGNSLVSSACKTPNINNKYIRSVEITQDGGCGLTFAHTTVKVSWTDGKCEKGVYCHASNLSSCLSTIPPIPTP